MSHFKLGGLGLNRGIHCPWLVGGSGRAGQAGNSGTGGVWCRTGSQVVSRSDKERGNQEYDNKPASNLTVFYQIYSF